MPLPPNPKCLACIDYSRAEAKRVHGPQGDDCWKNNTCDRKRNHYRHRKEDNAKRRGEYADLKATTTEVETVESIFRPSSSPTSGFTLPLPGKTPGCSPSCHGCQCLAGQ